MFYFCRNQVNGFYQQNVLKTLWKNIFTITLPKVFFKQFASKNQLPGLYKSETMVKNGLMTRNLLNLNTVSATSLHALVMA